MQNNQNDEAANGGILKTAASAIGSALGSVASTVMPASHQTSHTAAEPHDSPGSADRRGPHGRFPKNGKSRLPRRLKKAEARKAHAAG